MSRTTIATLFLLPLPAILNGCCGCCCGTSKPLSPQEKAARQQAEQEAVTALTDGLKAAAASPPATDALEEKACPDDAIGKRPWSSRRVLTVDREYLGHLADPEFDAEMDDNRDWAWLRSDVFAEASKGTDKLDPSKIRSARDRSYLAVFASDDKERPRVDGSGKFTPGHFDGWLIVVDLHSNEAICQAKLTAQSSPKIADDAEGAGTIADRQEKVDEDFQELFEEQANLAAQRISEELRVELGWSN